MTRDATTLIDLLYKYTNCIFDNEEKFIDRFLPPIEDAELVECTMSSARVHVVVLTSEGQHVIMHAPMHAVLAWCDERRELDA